MRFTKKPGELFTGNGNLPMCCVNAIACCTVSSEDEAVWTISTSGIIATGLKK